ncbi:hypothetical protein V8B55DRAFT_1139055 [Mucor lusitanicus]|uniref:Uncharacterized protein n=2 Tax=Mucor circinelloides f. lusitanicus TaxID=29924 RepID=A0A168IL23_MUCCL|nr:hypothetical protein MUCCIDRAFT_165889 [Mucor lusitanicus CBS 277.49]
MLPNVGTIMFPEMQYGPLIISAVTTAVMLVFCLVPSKRPGIIGYLCLAAGFVGIIASSLLLTTGPQRIDLVPYYYILYGVYNILIYIPVLVSFHLTARRQKRESKSNKLLQLGNCFIYLGYLWSVVVLAVGIAFLILRVKGQEYLNPNMSSTRDEESDRKSYVMSAQAAIFAYYSIWGFIAINLVLTSVFYSTFKNTFKRYALILFNLLTIIAMITNAVIPALINQGRFGFEDSKIIGFIGIFLLDLPNALAIVIWFFVHGGKPDRQQSVLLHGEADTDTTSSNANILPSDNHPARATLTNT